MSVHDFQLLAETAPVLLVSFSAAGELSWANHEWCAYTALRSFPRPAVSAVHIDQQEQLQASLALLIENPRRASHEIQLLRHDGAYRWFQLLLAPVLVEDRVTSIVGALFNLTDAKMIEEQMMELNASLETMVDEQTRHLKDANEQLKSAQSKMLQNEKMASIGQLAAGVAHEINNPMGFIGSNLNSLAKYLKKFSDFLALQDRVLENYAAPEERSFLQEQRKKFKIDFLLEDSHELIAESLNGADRVQKIVVDLKSFSRVDRAEVQASDLNECLESTLSIVWNELKYKVALEKDYGALNPLHCLPQQLNQVFMNILLNASQAIEKQGTIGIRTWQDELNQYVRISDDGCGMSVQTQTRIFEPFYTTKAVGKGTGLGMSISYDIVKKHGGEILLESGPGQGSVFTLLFPRSGIPKSGPEAGE